MSVLKKAVFQGCLAGAQGADSVCTKGCGCEGACVCSCMSLCGYICACTCWCMCMHVCAWGFVHTHLCMYVHMCTGIWGCVHEAVCVHKAMCACVYVCVCLHLCMRLCMAMHDVWASLQPWRGSLENTVVSSSTTSPVIPAWYSCCSKFAVIPKASFSQSAPTK